MAVADDRIKQRRHVFAGSGFVEGDAHGVMDLSKIDFKQTHHAVLAVGLYGTSVEHFTRQYVGGIIEDAAQHWLANDCKRVGPIHRRGAGQHAGARIQAKPAGSEPLAKVHFTPYPE